MRKKIVLISLTVSLFFFGVLCYKTWIAVFVVTKFLSGQTDGKQGIIKSIIIPWRNYELHLHHWFLALITSGILTVNGFYVLTPEIFYGSLSAIIFQGIYCYEDWHRIIRRKNAPPTWAQRMSKLDASVGIRKMQCHGWLPPSLSAQLLRILSYLSKLSKFQRLSQYLTLIGVLIKARSISAKIVHMPPIMKAK